MANVAVFWDYENTRVPIDTTPQAASECIRRVALSLGSLQSVRVYFDSAYEQGHSNSLARSQLQMSGFTLVDCPHAGSKDVADVQLISDMIVWAMEQGRASTASFSCNSPDIYLLKFAFKIILISGDKDFSYPLSLLRNRSINVVLMSTGTAPEGLKAAASSALVWRTVLGLPEKPPPKERTTLLVSYVTQSSHRLQIADHELRNADVRFMIDQYESSLERAEPLHQDILPLPALPLYSFA